MLQDYEDVHFHMHFFTGADDLSLSKIDSVMDNTIYDMEYVGINLETTLELHAVAGSLALFPISCFCSYFNYEVPEAYEKLVGKEIDGPFGDGYIPFIIAMIFSVLYGCRPFFLNNMVYRHTFDFYFSM